MAKILLLILVLAFVFWALMTQRRRSPPPSGDGPDCAPKSERIVVCAHCRVHVPESESIQSEGRHFCSEEHRKLGAA